MRSDWVAASVRARSMAQRRVGAGTCRSIAAAPGLQAGLDRLADTVYGEELNGARTLTEAHRATRRTVLWQLRVLAGWLPAGGTRLIRAAAAAFEADNILALDLVLRRQEAGANDGDAAADFDLGGLATAWPRLRTASTSEELQAALASSPWGDPGPDSALPDVLTAVWLRRLTAEAAAVRPWAAAAAALICARLLLVDGTAPADRLVALLRPLLGTAWSSTGVRETRPSQPHTSEPGNSETRNSETLTPETLRSTLPPSAAQALAGIDRSADLWRAEAALAVRIETDGFSLLRAGLPGPDVVLGAMTVLAADAWRVRAALAAAAVNAGASEVLDAVA
ncbi:hypothetical protein QNO08_06935 [Arthrobacter sp. zg-Y820]|uniref:hypothetical protein n=1 Tax=unclassified Arthrobacter TaxID=235627 RepID=UPI001E3CFDF4|nr:MULTISPECIES: hypothetical protein [unclassified Arthrobacter]MCC9197742.1 hypothetical protein [Arthrobacter sp. zg-Y820]MDK1280609.1 hypothetical protein [Arthrobacter sp. zg.Y820]WIB10755.1 hypothetical protein QNO08_06935 [Arthrobacter sp. zg-Y820]